MTSKCEEENHLMEPSTVGHVIPQNGDGKGNFDCTKSVNNHGFIRGLIKIQE